MLWYKNWLELRFRVVLCGLLILTIASLFGTFSLDPPKRAALQSRLIAVAQDGPWTEQEKLSRGAWTIYGTVVGMTLVPVGALMLAGSGINSQTNYGMMRGLHNSVVYTLSLPVRRRDLLYSRAGMGAAAYLLFAVAVMAVLPLAAALKGIPIDWTPLAGAWLRIVAGLVLFYSVALIFAVTMDEFTGGMVGLALTGMSVGYSTGSSRKDSWSDLLGLLQADASVSSGPWICLGVAALLVAASIWFVEKTEA